MVLTRSIYDSLAVEYDPSSQLTPYFSHLNARYREILSENASLLQASTVLDLGCGTGLYMEMISTGKAHYLGLDLSPEMLSRARLKSRRIGDPAKISLLRADAASLPLKSESIGGVVSIGMVLSHLSSYKKGLKEISRVLLGDGRFILELDNKWSVDLIHYLADALTAGKLFHYGFSSLQKISRYIRLDEYEWDSSRDGLFSADKILLHKISVRKFERLLTRIGLRVHLSYGVHFATFFIPRRFPSEENKVELSYLKLVEWLDRKLSQKAPFSHLGGSLIVVGKRVGGGDASVS